MSTVTRINDSLLLESARYFRDLGMAGWDWSLFQPIGRGRSGGLFQVEIDKLCGSWGQLFDAVADGEFDGFLVQPVKKYLDNFLHGPGGICVCARNAELLEICCLSRPMELLKHAIALTQKDRWQGSGP